MFFKEKVSFNHARRAFSECLTIEEVSDILENWSEVIEGTDEFSKINIGSVALVLGWKDGWYENNPEKIRAMRRVETLIDDSERSWNGRGIEIVEMEEPGGIKVLEKLTIERDVFVIKKMISFLGERPIPADITKFLATYEGGSSSPERK